MLNFNKTESVEILVITFFEKFLLSKLFGETFKKVNLMQMRFWFGIVAFVLMVCFLFRHSTQYLSWVDSSNALDVILLCLFLYVFLSMAAIGETDENSSSSKEPHKHGNNISIGSINIDKRELRGDLTYGFPLSGSKDFLARVAKNKHHL